MNQSISRFLFAGTLVVALAIALMAIFFARNAYVKESQSINHQQISAIKNQETLPVVSVATSTQNIANASSTSEAATTSTTDLAIDTSGWKIYRNEEFGFEMKIPSEWGLVKSGRIDNGDVMYSFQISGVNVNILTTKSTSTIQEIRKVLASEYMGVTYEDSEKMTVAGWEGYRKKEIYSGQYLTDGLLVYSDQMFLVGDGKYCTLSFSAGSEDERASAEEAAKWNVALKTLRNIAPSSTRETSVDTSNWKTCMDKKLGFEMKFPLDWQTNGANYGTGTIDDLGLWHYRIGDISWFNNEVNLKLTVRRTDLSLQDLNADLRSDFGLKPKEVVVNNLFALRRMNELNFDGSHYQYQDLLMLKKNDLIYSFDFGFWTKDELRAHIILDNWLQVIKEFQPISSQ